MKKPVTVTLLLLLGGLLPAAPAMVDFLEIHYIANEGTLLQFQEKQVLIDALFSEGLDLYESPGEKLELFRSASPPYDRVQLVLITHAHADHFDPELAVAYLQANRNARLLAPMQAVELMKAIPGGVDLNSRLMGRALAPGEVSSETIADIKLQILGIPHGGRHRETTENLGYIIELGGQRLLHVGDAIPSPSDFEPVRLAEKSIDIFLSPFWFLTGEEGAGLVENLIQPRRIIAIHVEAANAAQLQQQIQTRFPEALLFSNLLGKNIYLMTLLD